MTQTANITLLAQAIRDEFNSVKGIRGLLANLNTSDKSSLVAAINEVLGTAGNAAVINDGATNATEAWSSTKIDSELDARIAVVLGGVAPATLDTITEIAAAIQSNDGDIAAALTSITANATDIAAAQADATQALADVVAETAARTAADSSIRADYGDHTHDFVADFTTGLI